MKFARFGLQTFLLAMLLLVGGMATAQTTVTFSPPVPTANDVITARVTFQGLACSDANPVIVSGNTIQMTIVTTSCITAPPMTVVELVPFGPLPAGTYDYQLYVQYDSDPPVLQVEQPLVVGAASIPTVDRRSLLLLVVALLATSLFAVGRG